MYALKLTSPLSHFLVISGLFILFREKLIDILHKYFDKFLKGIDRASVIDNKKINDATLRLADGYFVIKDYDKALFSYNKIANDHIGGTDYALFQKGIILGLQGKQNDKIVTLKQVLNNYTKSAYADDATFEIANSYFSMNNNSDATLYFNNLIDTIGYII